jgi:hypothetical protein
MTYQEYAAFEAQGQHAQAYVGSILRGGFVLGDHFYFVSIRRERVPVSSVRELQFAPYSV